MSITKLERLKAQREALDKAIKDASAGAAKEKRNNDRDRKIIFGAWCMKHRPELLAKFAASLTTAREKALFAELFAPESTENNAPSPNPAPALHLQATGT